MRCAVCLQELPGLRLPAPAWTSFWCPGTGHSTRVMHGEAAGRRCARAVHPQQCSFPCCQPLGHSTGMQCHKHCGPARSHSPDLNAAHWCWSLLRAHGQREGEQHKLQWQHCGAGIDSIRDGATIKTQHRRGCKLVKICRAKPSASLLLPTMPAAGHEQKVSCAC